MDEKNNRNQVFLLDACSNEKRALLKSESSIAPSPSPSPSPYVILKDKHGDCGARNRTDGIERVDRDVFIQAVVEAFAKICPDLPRPEKVTSSSEMYRGINARCRNNRERRQLSWWVEYFSRVARSDLLMGRKIDWRANALWLVKPRNMEKVLMGTYDPRAAPARASPRGMSPVSESGTFEAVGGFFEDAMASGS